MQRHRLLFEERKTRLLRIGAISLSGSCVTFEATAESETRLQLSAAQVFCTSSQTTDSGDMRAQQKGTERGLSDLHQPLSLKPEI